MTGTCKTFTKNYTMVELLVVVSIVGILLAISMGGIGKMLGRQGASGAVRNISSQLSLTRSYAVMKNSYVALLIPCDSQYSFTFLPSPIPIGPPASKDYTSNNAIFDNYYFKQMRICQVVPNYSTTPVTYTFSNWIDGNEWEQLQSGTCVYVYENPQQVTGITIGTTTNLNVSAIVFKPSGVLTGSNPAKIKAFMAKYIPNNDSDKRIVIEGKRLNSWKITINPYTGRADYDKEN